MQKYTILFNGEIIKSNLQNPFITINIEGGKSYKLIKGQPQIIATAVNYETVMKYESAFQQAGAICSVVRL